MSTSVLPYVQAGLMRYGLSTILVLGTVGNTFVIILFRRRQQNPCTMYLLWAAVLSTATVTVNIIMTLYTLDHEDPGNSSLVFCKLRFYLTHIWGQIGRYFMVFACVERFVVTTNNARFRFITRPSIARWIMVITGIFWHIFLIHALFGVTVTNGRCGQFGVYYIVYQIYLLVFFSLIPSVSMAVFGFLGFRNLRRLHVRVHPVGNTRAGNPRDIDVHRRDQELLTMILGEVGVYVGTMFSYPFITLEIAVTNFMGITKSTERLQIESFVFTIATSLVYVNYTAAFYTYLTVSRAFRNDLKKLFTQRWDRPIKPVDASKRQRTVRPAF